jgi:putative protein-disulfide isomerase
MGGLAPDSDQPMPQVMQEQLQNTWRRIQQRLPETRFNFAFWTDNQPRRSTYPACRAVIAARELDPKQESAMILGIQQAYYLKAQNPSDDATLIRIAEELGLDGGRFGSLLNAPETQASLEAEIRQTRAMGASSFPSLVLQQGETSYWPVPVDYTDAGNMLDTIAMILD